MWCGVIVNILGLSAILLQLLFFQSNQNVYGLSFNLEKCMIFFKIYYYYFFYKLIAIRS